MSYSKPVACFRDVLLYCDFTESKNQDGSYMTYLNRNDCRTTLIDFIQHGLTTKKITSRNFLGDPDGIRRLFMEIMTNDQQTPPSGWLKHLKIKHFGRQWRLLGKEIKLIDALEHNPHEQPRKIRVSELQADLDLIDTDPMFEGYRRNRALYGDCFAAIIAIAYVEMFYNTDNESRLVLRSWLENTFRGN